MSPDRKLMIADFDGASKSAGPPRVVFQTRIVAPNFSNTQYDVARDGRILITSVPANYSSPLTLISGWTALLRSR